MPIALTLPGGWFDIPDTAWTAGNIALEDVLVALNALVRFGAVADEYFTADANGNQLQFRNGESVPLPRSADDGYSYSLPEALYPFALDFSANVDTQVNGGNGNVLYAVDYVEQDTGVVHSNLNYYVQGGQDSAATDGGTTVMVVTRRGAGAKIAAPVTSGGGPAGGGGTPYGGQGGQGDPLFKGGLVKLG